MGKVGPACYTLPRSQVSPGHTWMNPPISVTRPILIDRHSGTQHRIALLSTFLTHGHQGQERVRFVVQFKVNMVWRPYELDLGSRGVSLLKFVVPVNGFLLAFKACGDSKIRREPLGNGGLFDKDKPKEEAEKQKERAEVHMSLLPFVLT